MNRLIAKNMKIIVLLLPILLTCALTKILAQGTWKQKADFAGTKRFAAVGFSIGSKGYVGTGGIDGNTNYKDFWEYDPVTNAWSQKADFGGTARLYANGFSIANRGYIGLGESGTAPNNDFWEYDPAGNKWTKKADF